LSILSSAERLFNDNVGGGKNKTTFGKEMTMRFMVIVKAGKDCESGKLPTKEFMAAMGKYNDELARAGVLLALEGLAPTSKGARVKFAGKKPMVTDGPFPESKEVVGGFWFWKCNSKQEAIEWLKRAPFEDAEIELRHIYEPEEFAENFTRALREQEARARETLQARP
jgi:hypothetical protein